MEIAILVAVAALGIVFWFSGVVGKLRYKHGIKAPAMTGHPEFERAVRVHYNTLEQLAIFLPLYALCAWRVNAYAAAALGVVWIVGRVLFARGYWEDPAKRGMGFGISFVATAALALAVVAYAAADLAGFKLPR